MGNCGTLARRAATWTMAPSIRPSTLRATATWKKRRRSAGCGSRGKTRRTSRGLTATPGREGKMDLRDDYYPGDIGFDPLGLKPDDEEELNVMITKELQHGRLAMLAAAGFLAQEAVDGKGILEHFNA